MKAIGSCFKRKACFFWAFLLVIMIPVPGLCQDGDTRISNRLGMTFIRVNPGSFTMGSPETERFRDRNEVRHLVDIPHAFYLQETEVTLGQWWAVMGKKWLSRRKGPETLPVTKVSWYDCQKFIDKLTKMTGRTYRLPKEEEWEYACRAGTATAYSWGDAIDCSKAMYGNNEKKNQECIRFFNAMGIPANGPAPVKTFQPNAWGFYDMHGNVWEWCDTAYAEYMVRPGAAAVAPDQNKRVKRGGSWYKYARYLRSANRAWAHPGAKFQTTGFRLILEAE